MILKHTEAKNPYFTNTFMVVSENKNAVVIDAAGSLEQYNEFLAQEGATLKYIFITHGHHDHIGGIAALKKATGATVFISHEDAGQFNIVADEYFEDGGEILLDELVFKTIHTPGHTRGGYCIEVGDCLFTGDTLFAGEVGRCDLQGGDFNTMLQTLKKLQDTIKTDLKVLPGHSHFSTFFNELQNNQYMKMAK